MARKKSNRKELDEESLKRIYTGKNFVPPKEKELETIKEHDCETYTEEIQDETLKVFLFKRICVRFRC